MSKIMTNIVGPQTTDNCLPTVQTQEEDKFIKRQFSTLIICQLFFDHSGIIVVDFFGLHKKLRSFPWENTS